VAPVAVAIPTAAPLAAEGTDEPPKKYSIETDGGCYDTFCDGTQCTGCERATILAARQALPMIAADAPHEADEEPTVSVAAAPLVIASKINSFAFSLAKYAYKKIREASDKDIDYEPLWNFNPPEDELQAVVSEYYDILSADIEQGLIFADDGEGNNE
jgi:hypothetical protein